VQFLDFSVVIHLFIVVFDEDALLDEAVDEVDHHGIGLREQGKDFKILHKMGLHVPRVGGGD
jgi:hypothetical protein